MKSQYAWRGFYYVLGLVFLALGITLNTKTSLGISPLISVPSTVSEIYALNLGNVIAVYYVVMVTAQLFIRGKDFRLIDFLQAPMSVLFTRIINFFNANIDFSQSSIGVRLAVLAAAIFFTGVGVALSVDTQLIPNAADGLVGAIAQRTGKEMGFVKNMVDLCAVILTVVIGMVLIRRVICVGLGTLMTVLGVGRVVSLFNHLYLDTIRTQSGLNEPKRHKAPC